MTYHIQMLVSSLKILSILLTVKPVLTFDPKTICTAAYSADLWNYVPCDEYFQPDRCSRNTTNLMTLDDFDRCGPSYMSVDARNYFLGASGRKETYKNNKRAIRKIKIVPLVLRDVSKNSTKVTILGKEIDYPIGISPVAFLGLANPDGEIALASGLSSFNSIYIMSHYATSSIEDVAKTVKGTPLHLWMQTYILKNLSATLDVVHKAEKHGFEAIVVTADTNAGPYESCNARDGLILPPGEEVVNVPTPDFLAAIAHNTTFDIITYLKSKTKLPIVAKGILSGADAIKAIKAGASAIYVSNHGGRQTGYDPATIDALPGIVDTVKKYYPHIQIYMDGGIRGGYDVYKALARGADMVFMGRPAVWGIAYNGSEGAYQVMDTITKEFQNAMVVSGHTHPSQIARDTLLPQTPTFLEE